MDATCNGFQHLALLSSSNVLAKELNLVKSSKKDKPKDFYSFLVSCLKDYLKNQLNTNKNITISKRESYERLLALDIKRFMIKKSIMTIPYNVSPYQLVNYIKENFVSINNEDYVSKQSINNTEIKLKYKDFTVLGDGLREVLNHKFPKLVLLLKYLDDLASLCTLLQIPILWSVPSGLEVKQGYMEEKTIRIKPFAYNKSKFVLKIPDRNTLNKNKQITAFMPNLVHSLDATSMTMLLKLYFENYSSNNIYTVHDCFAVTCNNVSNLLETIKLIYIELYSKDAYLLKLDKQILRNIKEIYGEDCYDKETRTIYIPSVDMKLQYPDVNNVLSKDMNFDSLKDSEYILN